MRSALVVALLAIPATASAHIYLTEPVGRGEPPNGDPQKIAHCGIAGRIATRVTTLLPGASITVKFRETINHAGWYRISFQPDGETFSIPPASNGPNAAGNPSNYPTEDLTGMIDGAGAHVLMDRIPDDGNLVQKEIQITLPDVECTNCTLQLLSVMTNGATYNPANNGSLYFQCADITLAANAPDAGPQATGDAGVDAAGPGGNNDSGMLSGGCSAGGGAGLPVALGLLGFARLRRRRRRC
jgi:uncharacterized protein (TIGR03382 family)